MNKKNNSKNIKFIITFLILFLNSSLVLGASLRVMSFSCSPSETSINSLFSCSATVEIIDAGTDSITLSTATLYPDASDWLENSNYAQSSGTTLSASNPQTSVIFTGLRAVKSGNNGFSKIMLDSVTDTYVADNNKKVNVINIVASVSNSASSATKGETWTTTVDVTAGGNIDVSLSFSSTSGGCSIGSQTNPKTISGMTDGSKQSRTWEITQGTSGNCVFSVVASATGVGGVANKIDSSSKTVTCSDCPVDSGGGSGGGGGGIASNSLGEISKSGITTELAEGGAIKFSISGRSHTLTLLNITDNSAIVTIQSEKQTLSLFVGDEKKVDLNSDGIEEVSIKLKSVNIYTSKAVFILTKLIESDVVEAEQEAEKINQTNGEKGAIGNFIENMPESTKNVIKISVYIIIGVIIVVIICIIIGTHRLKKYLAWINLIRSVKVIDKPREIK